MLISECCINKGVQSQCLDVCSFDVDFTFLRDPLNLRNCYDQVDEMMECLAGWLIYYVFIIQSFIDLAMTVQLVCALFMIPDGRDNRRCCIRKGVPESCQPFCVGERPAEDVIGSCLEHHVNIADCMEQGHRKHTINTKNSTHFETKINFRNRACSIHNVGVSVKATLYCIFINNAKLYLPTRYI